MTTTEEKIWVAVETGAMAFGGAAIACVEQSLVSGFPSTSAQWDHVIAAAIAAGIVGLIQRYRRVPGTVSVPVSTVTPSINNDVTK